MPHNRRGQGHSCGCGPRRAATSPFCCAVTSCRTSYAAAAVDNLVWPAVSKADDNCSFYRALYPSSQYSILR
jgi:hypothetical protein